WVRAAAGVDTRVDDEPAAQCVHGEVHQGNVVFADGRAVLVDLEEAARLYAPPAWDLAYLVQRFCLTDAPAPAERGARLAAVAEGYGAPLPPLAATMQRIARLMLLTIVDAWVHDGVRTPVT